MGICDEEQRECAPLPSDDGEPCDDADTCTVEDTCFEGVCSGVSFCGVPVTRGIKPTVRDSLFILRGALELEECLPCECDVNGDGTINTTDALLDLRIVVELPGELACGGSAAASTADLTSTTTAGTAASTTTTTSTSTLRTR
jgi:hypothetical protein